MAITVKANSMGRETLMNWMKKFWIVNLLWRKK